MKNYSSVKLILVSLLVPLFFSENVFSSKPIIDLEETPLGFYKQYFNQHQFIGGAREQNLPDHYLINVSPIKNQNPLGTCVSFTASACCEYRYLNNNLRFSEAEFTILAKTILSEPCKPGLFLGEALSVAKEYGFVTEDRLSYTTYLDYVAHKNSLSLEHDNFDNANICEDDKHINYEKYNATMNAVANLNSTYKPIQLKGNKEADISQYRLNTIIPIHHVSKDDLYQSLLTKTSSIYQNTNNIGVPANADLESVKCKLHQNCLVATAISVIWDYGWKDGKHIIGTPKPKDWSYNINGSHAIILTGFNDKQNCFMFKNSWGTEWGIDGFGYISYDYIRTYATELIAIRS